MIRLMNILLLLKKSINYKIDGMKKILFAYQLVSLSLCAEPQVLVSPVSLSNMYKHMLSIKDDHCNNLNMFIVSFFSNNEECVHWQNQFW